jgi:hypothetical protein
MNIKTQITKVMATIHDINEKNINGEIDALESFVYLDRLTKHIKSVMEGIKPDAVQQAWNTSDENQFDMYGSKITKKNATGRFDFKGCKSWADKKAELNDIERELKHAHALYERGNIIADGDGVEMEIPVKKYGDDTLALVHFID